MNRSIVEEPFVPRVARQHEMIKGVTLNTLMGYVTTRAKSGSQTVLTAPSGDPILAQWQYGTGKTTAFTSDAKNRWAAQWIRNSKSFAQFWGQVVRSTMKTDDERQFDMRIVRENAHKSKIREASVSMSSCTKRRLGFTKMRLRLPIWERISLKRRLRSRAKR